MPTQEPVIEQGERIGTIVRRPGKRWASWSAYDYQGVWITDVFATNGDDQARNEVIDAVRQERTRRRGRASSPLDSGSESPQSRD